MMEKMKNRKKKKGFTLIELIVVIAIIGILVLIAVPRFASMTDTANERTFEANHRIAVSAITMSVADNNGALPAEGETFANEITGGIDGLQGDPVGATYKWDGAELTSTFDGTTLTFTP